VTDTDQQTELEFLNDLNALLSETLDGKRDYRATLRTLESEIRERIDTLEAGE